MLPRIVKYLPYLAWSQALVSTVGSLYFSEILGYAPCTLCWYQRIFTYPLVLIIAIGIYRENKEYIYYSLPLAVIGFFISIYQNLLYYGVLKENTVTCSNGVSCITKYVEYFGFISIPILALVSFLVIIASLYITLKYSDKKKK